MGIIENDPRDIAYVALYIAIKWYQPISVDTAVRLANGSSNAIPGVSLTPKTFQEIKRVIESPNFKNMSNVVRRFRVNEYEIYEALAADRQIKYKHMDEGVVNITQIEIQLRRLKERAENCNGANCEKCFLNTMIDDFSTWCEILCDLDMEDVKRPLKNRMQKSAINCTLTGDTKRRGFEIYNSVLEELDKYIQKNNDRKVRDIVSMALLDYLNKELNRRS